MNKTKILKKITKILFLPIIFLMAVVVWYSPVLFKNGTPFTPGQNEVIARNIIETGKFSSESTMNVVLNSDSVKLHGVTSSKGDKMISLLSAGLYKIFGLPQLNSLALFSVIISSLVLVIFSILVWKMFGFFKAAVFAILYIFFPVMWQTALQANFYEYGLFFLACGLFLFFWQSKKFAVLRYIGAGFFLALSFLSRDALALLAPALLAWMWFYKRKYVIHLFLSLLITVFAFNFIFGYFFGKSNNYHLVFFRLAEENTQGKDFNFYGHLYPDPYTYLFEKEKFINKQKEIVARGGLESQYLAKQISNIESNKISLWEHLRLGPLLFLKQITSLVSLENVGGPFIFALFCLGLSSWYRKRRDFFWFAVLWIGSVLSFTSFVALAQRNHVMDFGFIFVLGTVAGYFELLELLKKKEDLDRKHIYILTSVILLGGIIYQLVLSSHVMWSNLYDQNNNPRLEAYGQAILNKNLSSQEVIATPLDNGSIYGLHFLTNKSIVKFSNQTIEKLLEEEKLDQAFKEFGVNKILGFSSEKTVKIVTTTKIENIADNSIIPTVNKISPLRSLLMNLVK